MLTSITMLRRQLTGQAGGAESHKACPLNVLTGSRGGVDGLGLGVVGRGSTALSQMRWMDEGGISMSSAQRAAVSQQAVRAMEMVGERERGPHR